MCVVNHFLFVFVTTLIIHDEIIVDKTQKRWDKAL